MQESKRCMGHNERCKIYEFDVPEREEKEGRTEATSEEKEIFLLVSDFILLCYSLNFFLHLMKMAARSGQCDNP